MSKLRHRQIKLDVQYDIVLSEWSPGFKLRHFLLSSIHVFRHWKPVYILQIWFPLTFLKILLHFWKLLNEREGKAYRKFMQYNLKAYHYRNFFLLSLEDLSFQLSIHHMLWEEKIDLPFQSLRRLNDDLIFLNAKCKRFINNHMISILSC